MRHLLTLIISLSLVLVGCEDRQQSQTVRQPPKIQSTVVPPDVSYAIIDSHTIPGIKRSLDIRLNKKVSEETLRAIAIDLKSQDLRDYDRTFIVYYLPKMTVGAGGWATSHFNPSLEVRIFGLTPKEEEILVAESMVPADQEIIGRWLDESPIVGCRITIFLENGVLFIERMFKDGSKLKQRLTERQASSGRRFDKVEGSNHGDHWILGSDGNLQIRDNEGLIVTARKIE